MIPYTVALTNRNSIREFIEKWHYSKSINGVISDYCFGLYDNDILIGAMIYGRPAMAGQWKKYVAKSEDLLELRRLCCIDDTPKNTESFFIGHTLRWLARNTAIKIIISYADANYGHRGIIYKASNFQYLGTTQPGKMIQYKGKLIHDKAIRTKYNGELKPFAKKLKEALRIGEAIYVHRKPKHIYLYEVR